MTCGMLMASLLFASFLISAPVIAQTTQIPTHTFYDPTYHLSFDYPANWNFSRIDGEISTFHLDARSAPKQSSLRFVVAVPENPLPASTFSGAYVYFSVTPHSSASDCARQAARPDVGDKSKPTATRINDISFTHGHDEQKNICITQRDDIYTTYRRGSCLRFDLASNNFCGGEVSGVKDITSQELDQVRTRLEAILSTVRFDPR
jgi:hypothetical protein